MEEQGDTWEINGNFDATKKINLFRFDHVLTCNIVSIVKSGMREPLAGHNIHSGKSESCTGGQLRNK